MPAPLLRRRVPGRQARRVCRLAGRWIAAWLLLVQGLNTAAQAPATEKQIKAAFLYNFARFVEWPAEVLAHDERPFFICLLGGEAPRQELEQIVSGKFLDRHPIRVTQVREAGTAKCHILFISGDSGQTRQWLERLRGSSILTVGESQNFCELGGVINFWRESEHVRFEISPRAAALAHLRLSSKLLRLARIVESQAQASGGGAG
jgi:hypothetical protein